MSKFTAEKMVDSKHEWWCYTGTVGEMTIWRTGEFATEAEAIAEAEKVFGKEN